MASISSNSIVIIIVVGIFLIADIILSAFIIVESGKYHTCLNKESGFCLKFACPYSFDNTYTPFQLDSNGNPVNGNTIQGADINFDNPNQIPPDATIGANKCLGYPYRLIDKTKGHIDSNIECRLPPNGGVNTQTPTTLKPSST